MPIDSIIVITAIIVPFGLLAATLPWAVMQPTDAATRTAEVDPD
jgi:multisubunit Na+/H+ antiporter MnhC subunit